MLHLYTITIFLNAALLFWVEPLIGRMVLPLLGGGPAIWNTCMVFFQAMVLLGYLYAHASTSWLGVRRQAVSHLLILLLPALMLPIGIGTHRPPTTGSPALWLLGVLVLHTGLPLFTIAAGAPMLQRWFAAMPRSVARDPYPLYAASNLGSLFGLLSYPFIVEPWLRLQTQSRLWSLGYVLLGACTAGCALLLLRRPPEHPGAQADAAVTAPAESLTVRRRLRWIALSLVPSSLLLGVTSHISTDIASLPLLWVVPFALYLLTFVVAFSTRQPRGLMLAAQRLAPTLALSVVAVLIATQVFSRVAPVMTLNLVAFTAIALACHGELAGDRPAPRHLTEFYLWLSLGGVLGGMLNALLAPLILDTVVEYPLALIAAAALLRSRRSPAGLSALGVAITGAVLAVLVSMTADRLRFIGSTSMLGLYGVPLALSLVLAERLLHHRLVQVGLLLVVIVLARHDNLLVYRERTFFGVHRVRAVHDGAEYRLLHGTTIHGLQFRDPQRRREPSGYYHADGPYGQVFSTFCQDGRKRQVAVAGLGAGSLAAFGEPGQRMVFYEIDPAVARIAASPNLFTFLSDSRAQVEVILGDARLRLQDAPPNSYGMLAVDAFSSDTIPVHLVTREAMQVYLRVLQEDGVLAFHISNHHFALAPVFSALAQDAGLVGRWRTDPEDLRVGKWATDLVVLARRMEHLGPLAQDPRWQPLPAPVPRLWTDDYANVVSALR